MLQDHLRVVVFGAGGRSGRLIVDRLLAAGHDVSAALRDPATFRAAAPPAPGRPAAQVLRADVRDLDSVRAAVAGHDVVVSAIGAGRHAQGLHEAGATTLVAAMDGSPADRLIVLSASGATLNDPDLPLVFRLVIRPLLFREVYADVRAMEDVVRASSLNWTLVRPARLLDTPATGTYRVRDGANPPGGGKVTRADLADFVVASLGADSWSRAAPSLAE